MTNMTKFFARQAILAALYVILTLSGFGVSYGPIQFRFSEVMTWFAFFDPKNIVGLALGCFLANIPSPFGLLDMFVGTLGTVLAALFMAKVKSKWIAAIGPALPAFLYAGEALVLGQITMELFPIVTGQMMLSQLIIVGVIGLPLMMVLTKSKPLQNAFHDPTQAPTKKDWAGVDAFPL